MLKFVKPIVFFLLLIIAHLTVPIYSQVKINNNISIEDKNGNLKYFIQSLKESSKSKVRIGHFGDSIIQGDVITEYLREFLQSKFGGKGIGLLSPTPANPKMRESVIQEHSSDWTYFAINTRNPNNYPVGISGTISISDSKSSFAIKCTDNHKSIRNFDILKIYYTNAQLNSVLKLKIDGKSENIKLKPGIKISEININKPNSRVISGELENGKNIYFHGISLESNNGIYVDNFPIAGNSGAALADISTANLAEINSFLNYKLLILQYGVNIAVPNKTGLKIYENKMIQIINNLKKTFPQTSILLVGASDKTTKSGSKYITDPILTDLIKTQKYIAEQTKIAYWNLWEAMGGENSMSSFVNNNPQLALKDYTHFNHKGGEIVARLLFDAIVKEISKY